MAGFGAGSVLAERYRLMAKLGEGAMGSVWSAEHVMLGSQVAIKLLDDSIARNSVALARFLREARAAASLKSIHIAQVHDYGVDRGIPYIAMEFLEGETLAHRMRRVRKLTPSETALILTHVARGVGRAHENGVIHRDLKPENIFILTEEDEAYVKVLDFGVAKAMDGVFSTVLTSAGKLLGTPAYMSAEQAAGRHVDHRTDLWSMAVIAFECITGRLPFVGNDVPSLLSAIHEGPIPIPSTCGAVPAGFDEWFIRGVSRSLDERFYSAKSLATELREICGVELGSSSAGSLAAARSLHRSTGLDDADGADDPEESTSRRIARAFGAQRRREYDSGEGTLDDIIRTEDIVHGGRDARAPSEVPRPGERSDSAPVISRSVTPGSESRGEPQVDRRPSGSADWRAASADPATPGSEPSSSLGAILSIRPRRPGQLGLLVGAAVVVVVGTLAGAAAFLLSAPVASHSAAVPAASAVANLPSAAVSSRECPAQN